MVDCFYFLNCALDIGNTQTHIQWDKERSSQEEMSRKHVNAWVWNLEEMLQLGTNLGDEKYLDGIENIAKVM